MLITALIINTVIVISEFVTLGHIRGKRNILKYYTYLQNFLALIASLIFSVCSVVCLISGRAIPESIRGLRYVATCGLLATMFMFIVFLGAGKKLAITEDDFLPDFRPVTANIILHYICPILSTVSFLLFEREITVSNGIWTAIAAIPSCVYWIAYMLLSLTNAWEEPYSFVSPGKALKLWDMLSVLLIPFSFIAISYILWNMK